MTSHSSKACELFSAIFLSVLLSGGFFSNALAEDVTVTSYYPAPSGVYQQITTTGNTNLATTAAARVGVGTTTPTSKLHVINSLAFGTQGSSGVGVTGEGEVFGVQGTSSATGGTGVFGGAETGVAAFGSTTDFHAMNPAGNSIFDGNVGIGTPSPASRLDVNGTINATGITLASPLTAAAGGTGRNYTLTTNQWTTNYSSGITIAPPNILQSVALTSRAPKLLITFTGTMWATVNGGYMDFSIFVSGVQVGPTQRLTVYSHSGSICLQRLYTNPTPGVSTYRGVYVNITGSGLLYNSNQGQMSLVIQECE